MQAEKVETFLNNMENWSWEKIGLWVMLFFLSTVAIVLSYQGKLPLDIDHFVFLFFLLILFTLYRPRLGFFALVFFLPFEMVNLAPSILGLALRPYQLLTSALLIALSLRILGGKMDPRKIRFIGLDVLPVGILAGALLAVPGALVSGIALKQALVLVSFLALYIVARVFLKSNKVRQEALLYLYGGALVVTLLGLWQNIQDKLGGVSHMVMTGRPNSTFFEADWLGFYLAVIGVMLVGELVVGIKKLDISWFTRITWWMHHALFVLVLIELILTVSRSAWLAFAIGVIVLFIGEGYRLYQRSKGGWVQYLRKVTHLIGIGVFALAVIFVFHLTRFHIGERAGSTTNGYQSITVACETVTALPERVESLEELTSYHCQHIDLEAVAMEEKAGKTIQKIERPDPNFSIRSQIYQKSWSTLKTHFLFGIGLGNSAQFLGVDERGAGLNTSNLFLETWLGAGLLGFISLISLWVVLFIRFVWSIKRGIEPERYIVGLAILSLVTVFNLFNAGMFLGVFFFVLALLVTISNPPADYKKV